MPTFSNQKKVRGWKRRLRQLERFRLAHRALDVEALRASHYDYVKVWLDPWSRLGGRNGFPLQPSFPHHQFGILQRVQFHITFLN